ncbi:hypothetical protein SAMN05519103_09292 [Rhizobiales bacterium GAS113]|jgi:hypothetical protein|nr:hypothetical protein SAMN05519103_09292 [Rhizobiales bacterium GAS113]
MASQRHRTPDLFAPPPKSPPLLPALRAGLHALLQALLAEAAELGGDRAATESKREARDDKNHR